MNADRGKKIPIKDEEKSIVSYWYLLKTSDSKREVRNNGNQNKCLFNQLLVLFFTQLFFFYSLLITCATMHNFFLLKKVWYTFFSVFPLFKNTNSFSSFAAAHTTLSSIEVNKNNCNFYYFSELFSSFNFFIFLDLNNNFRF